MVAAARGRDALDALDNRAGVRMTSYQAAMLRRLSEENQAVPVVKAFTRSFLPENGGSTKEIPKHFDVVTLPGRFAASRSILGLGWYCFGLGAFLLACYAVSRLPGERVVSSLSLVSLPVGVLTIVGIPSIIGQYYFPSGFCCSRRRQERAGDR